MTRTALALAGLLFATPAVGGDAADLFPADTLAYAEAARPADLAAGVAAVLEGGPLADPVKAARDRFDKLTHPFQAAGASRAALWSLAASPEFLAEAKRLRAVAVGVVGFNARGEPRTVAAVLTGDSHAAGLAARAYLAADPDLARVANVDGVAVYQVRGTGRKLTGADGRPAEEQKVEPAPPPAAAWEPTFAYTPGLLVAGTDVPAVTDVLQRFAGKQRTPSLSQVDGFRQARAEQERRGVFFSVDLQALVAKHDAAAKVSGGVDPNWLSFVRFAVNPKAVTSLTGHITVGKDAMAVTVDALIDPSVPSPLAAVLTGPGTAPAYLRPVAGIAGVIAVELPSEGRPKVLLDLADAVARSRGTLGRLPSEAATRAERDLLASVKAATVLVPAPTALPTLVVYVESEADAAKWEATWPRLVRLLIGSTQTTEPSSELIGGVRVFTLADDGLPGKAPVHAARVGAAVAFGPDRGLVIAAAVGKGADATPATAAPAAGFIHLGILFPAPVAPPKPPAPDDGNPRPPEPWFAGLARLTKPLPPVGVAATRTTNRLQFEAKLPEPGKSVSAGLAAFLDWYARQPVVPASPRYLPPGVIER